MAKPGLRKIHRYSDEFKATAVRLSHLPGVAVRVAGGVGADEQRTLGGAANPRASAGDELR